MRATHPPLSSYPIRFSRTAKATDLHITCDNDCKLFVDGVKQAASAAELADWTKTTTITIEQGARVLAVEAEDRGVIAGILASMDDGTTSDASWKCSRVSQTGWKSASFEEDGGWKAATEIGQNGVSPWNVRPRIDGSAKWIWTSRYEGKNVDLKVYCRKVLGSKCNAGKLPTTTNPNQVYPTGIE